MIPGITDYDYTVIIIALCCMASILWCVCMWINRKQNVQYYSYGVLLLIISYIPLVLRNYITYKVIHNTVPFWISDIFNTQELVIFNFQLTTVTMVFQVCGVIYFVLAFFYQKWKLRQPKIKILSLKHDAV